MNFSLIYLVDQFGISIFAPTILVDQYLQPHPKERKSQSNYNINKI